MQRGRGEETKKRSCVGWIGAQSMKVEARAMERGRGEGGEGSARSARGERKWRRARWSQDAVGKANTEAALARSAAKMAKTSATPRQRSVEAGEASVRRCEEAGEITA